MALKVFLTSLLLISEAAWSALPTTISGDNLISNGKVTLQTTDKSSRGTVVVFLSASCPCSNSHIEGLSALAEKYKDFKFIGVHSNIDESVDMAKKYFATLSLNFPVIQDDKAVLANSFKALKTPHAYIVSQNGEILFQGGVTNSADGKGAKIHYLEDALEDLHNNRKVKTTNTRTLGCVIMREKNSW